MADKRFLDENDNRKFSVDDDYIEIIDDAGEDIFSSSLPDVIELEPDDIFSSSSNDVYIGKRAEYETDKNIYFTKRDKPSQQPVSRQQPQPRPAQRQQIPVQRPVQRQQVPPQRPVQRQHTPEQIRQQQLRDRQRAQQQANMRRADSRYDTQKIRVVDSEEISDFDARRKKIPPKVGAPKKKSPAIIEPARYIVSSTIIGERASNPRRVFIFCMFS